MKKLVILGMALVLAIGAGMLMAKAVKLNLKPWDGDGGNYEPNAYGQAILNYAKGADKTEIQVNCWGLKPNTEYFVWLETSGWMNIGKFVTLKNGSGQFHYKAEGDVSLSQVTINSPIYDTVLYSK